jgi:VanZ family protein
MRLKIFLTALVLTLMFIWANSLVDKSVSNHYSENAADMVLPLLNMEETQPSADFMYAVRKGAHLLEFLALGIELAAIMVTWEKKGYNIFAVLFFVLLTAVIDESLQIFSDRADSVTDILIDFIGGLIGVSLVLITYNALIRRRNKKDEST